MLERLRIRFKAFGGCRVGRESKKLLRCVVGHPRRVESGFELADASVYLRMTAHSGLNLNDRVSKYSLQQHWDRQDARECLRYGRILLASHHATVLEAMVGHAYLGALDYLQVWEGIEHLRGRV